MSATEIAAQMCMKVNLGKSPHKEIAGPCDAVPTNRKCCSVGIALKVATRFAGGVKEGHQTEHNEEVSLHLVSHWKMERKTIRHHIFGVAEAHVGCARHEEAKKNWSKSREQR